MQGYSTEIQKGITVTNSFQKILDKFALKPNEIWVGQVSEFYNRSLNSWLHHNCIEMYSIHNRKICCCKKIYQNLEKQNLKRYVHNIKNVYIDNLDEVVDKYNNTCYRTIKMKPVDVQLGTYIEYGLERNDRDPKFKFADHIRTTIYKKYFCEGLHS